MTDNARLLCFYVSCAEQQLVDPPDCATFYSIFMLLILHHWFVWEQEQWQNGLKFRSVKLIDR